MNSSQFIEKINEVNILNVIVMVLQQRRQFLHLKPKLLQEVTGRGGIMGHIVDEVPTKIQLTLDTNPCQNIEM